MLVLTECTIQQPPKGMQFDDLWPVDKSTNVGHPKEPLIPELAGLYKLKDTNKLYKYYVAKSCRFFCVGHARKMSTMTCNHMSSLGCLLAK